SSFFFLALRPLTPTLFPYTTLFRSVALGAILIATSLISNEAPSKPVPDDPILLSHYIGKTVLVGVRELGRDKRPKRQMEWVGRIDRKSTRLNSSHRTISYAVFCLKK